MALTKIDFDHTETNSFTNLFTYLNNRSYIHDPRDPSGNKQRSFVYDFDPFHLSINFDDMPYIILDQIVPVDQKNSLDNSHAWIRVTNKITVRTARRGAGNSISTDIGRTDMLAICDDLHEVFNTKERLEELKNLNMTNLFLKKISTDTMAVQGKYAYESVFELQYDIRWYKTGV